jgi:hypothetical protein
MLIEGQDALLENMAGKPATATSRKHDCFYCLQGPSARRSWWPLVALFWRFPFSTVSGPHIQGEKGPKIVCRSTTWFLKAWQYTEILPTVSAASIFPSMSFKEGFFAVNSRPEQSIKKEKPRCRNSGNLPNWSKYPWMRPGHGFEGIAQTLQFKNRQVISIVPDGVHTHSNSLYPFSPSKARYIYIYPSYNTFIYISLSLLIHFIYICYIMWKHCQIYLIIHAFQPIHAHPEPKWLQRRLPCCNAACAHDWPGSCRAWGRHLASPAIVALPQIQAC